MKGWRMPDNTVSVARPSKWGNPYVVGQMASITTRTHDGLIADGFTIALTAQNCVDLFRLDLAARIEDPDWPNPHKDDIAYVRRWQTMLEALRGKNLGCFCPLDQPCHRSVLLEFANRPKR